jgi:membrane-associated protein
VIELAASFDAQLSPLSPFLLYIIVWGLVFVETALLIGFFLPGDSILFSAGLVAATRDDVNIALLASGVFLVAFLGDQIAFVFGRHFGRPYLEKRMTPRRERMIRRSERFYEDYGFWAIIIARYLPWVRTFVPVIAGIGRMHYYRFLIANLIGALSWGVLITVAGFYAGSIPAVKQSSYVIAAIFIALSIITSVRRAFKKKP